MSAVRQMLEMNIRPMSRADVVTVAQIETDSYPFPWSLGIFRDCLQSGYVCRVLETSAGMAGYAVLNIAAGEAHILNLCIRPDLQRQRLGSRFLQHLIDEIQRQGAGRIILEVRPSNAAARMLYAASGFTVLGVRRGYYPSENGREDALVLELALDQRRRVSGPV